MSLKRVVCGYACRPVKSYDKADAIDFSQLLPPTQVPVCNIDQYIERPSGIFSCWVSGGAVGRRRRSCRRSATVSRTVAGHVERDQTTRIDSLDELCAAFPKIRRMLRRRKTALLLLADGSDKIADYLRWLQAHGVVYRSMDGPVFLDAMRRVARGELFIQDGSSDARKDAPNPA